MLNISSKVLAEKIVDRVVQDLHDVNFEQSQKLFKRWRIDIQKIISHASSGVTYKAFFDGSATPNPGEMVIGGYIEQPNQKRIYEYSYEIGYGTNNQSEYSSLLHLCHSIVAHQILKVRIHGDSNLVINQVNGASRAKHPNMIFFRNEVREVLKKISDWNLVHIPRKQNKKADYLT